MTRSVAIYQPRYFPRLHYLSRAVDSSVFVLLDDVEFSRGSRQHRAEIPIGSARWLTIPVRHTGEEVLINEAQVDTSNRFAEKHYRTLLHKYGKDARCFESLYDELGRQNSLSLVDVTIPTLLDVFTRFGIETEVHRSSEMASVHEGDASTYLATLTEEVGGDEYIAGGRGYVNYLEESPFEQRGLDVTVQEWDPIWPEGNVCCLDVLFGTSEPEKHVEP